MIEMNELISGMLAYGAGTIMTERMFLKSEINAWRNSKERKEQMQGNQYYGGRHDILDRQRTAIGTDGRLTIVHNLPNNLVIDNQYAKAVDQKTNYLLGKPLTFETENKPLAEAIKGVLGKSFQRTLKNLCMDALNGGIAWLYPYYDEDGYLAFKRFAAYEVLPFWRDQEHTDLEMAIRLYEVEGYEGVNRVTIEKVEVYTESGVRRYTLRNGELTDDGDAFSDSYVELNGEGYNWSRIPLIAFKSNSREIPLIRRVKSLQDGINLMMSDFQNNMQEDGRNSILVLENYDGQDLGEFRENLATYGAVKVRSAQGEKGDVRALTVEMNAENYRVILDQLKKALIENARGYDAKNDRLSGQPNQMNIQSMYSDIDLDANGMEIEFQAALEEVLWFVKTYLGTRKSGIQDMNTEVNIIFNRDMLINETEAIDNCRKSVGLLSEETIVGQHPWTSDVPLELKRLKEEEDQALQEGIAYGGLGTRDDGKEAGGDVDGK